MKKAIVLKNISKSFSASFFKQPTTVLHRLSLSVNQGSITGFLGANGAGKTTTFKCILGLVFADEGEIEFFESGPLSTALKSRIGFMPERPQFPEYLSGEEFLRYYLSLYQNIDPKNIKKKIDYVLEMVGLLKARNRQIRTYSKGMLQRLGIAQSIIHDPDLVILDEPMSGLDPDGRYEVSQLILDIHKAGKTIFFSSHLLDDIQKLCNDLVILKSGESLFEGSKVDFMKKFKNSFRIIYIEGGVSKTIDVDSIESLNERLDQLRQEGKSIIEVSPKNTLEQAYVSFQRGET